MRDADRLRRGAAVRRRPRRRSSATRRRRRPPAVDAARRVSCRVATVPWRPDHRREGRAPIGVDSADAVGLWPPRRTAASPGPTCSTAAARGPPPAAVPTSTAPRSLERARRRSRCRTWALLVRVPPRVAAWRSSRRAPARGCSTAVAVALAAPRPTRQHGASPLPHRRRRRRRHAAHVAADDATGVDQRSPPVVLSTGRRHVAAPTSSPSTPRFALPTARPRLAGRLASPRGSMPGAAHASRRSRRLRPERGTSPPSAGWRRAAMFPNAVTASPMRRSHRRRRTVRHRPVRTGPRLPERRHQVLTTADAGDPRFLRSRRVPPTSSGSRARPRRRPPARLRSRPTARFPARRRSSRVRTLETGLAARRSSARRRGAWDPAPIRACAPTGRLRALPPPSGRRADSPPQGAAAAMGPFGGPAADPRGQFDPTLHVAPSSCGRPEAAGTRPWNRISTVAPPSSVHIDVRPSLVLVRQNSPPPQDTPSTSVASATTKAGGGSVWVSERCQPVTPRSAARAAAAPWRHERRRPDRAAPPRCRGSRRRRGRRPSPSSPPPWPRTGRRAAGAGSARLAA